MENNILRKLNKLEYFPESPISSKSATAFLGTAPPITIPLVAKLFPK